MTEAQEAHDWHLFDTEKRSEVARYDDKWHIRYLTEDGAGEPLALTDEEFDQLRSAGPNPVGID
jgi:hypothetical protein